MMTACPRPCSAFMVAAVMAIRFAAAARSSAAGIVVPLHLHEQRTMKGKSFLAVASETRSQLEEFRARHNNTHAIEYYGYISVGNQSFRVLFDTGSDSLILPGVDCVSSACKTHRVYDATKSHTAVNLSKSEARECKFGAGSVMGYEREDRVCLGSACADAEFVEALIESDDPFLHGKFDGVLGLSLVLRKNATAKANVLEAMVAASTIPRAVFAVFLSKELHSDASELSLGSPDPSRMAGQQTWVPLSEPGYWQFSLRGITVGKKELGACSSVTLSDGMNVSSFFGTSTQGSSSPTCCSSLDEFDYEDRCQFWGNASDQDDDGTLRERSRFTHDGTVMQSFPDGRVVVRLGDGCMQKVPRKWVSLPDGCRGDGTIQAVLDTGSSLMMAPESLAKRIITALGVEENCSAQEDFPSLTLTLLTGETLVLTAADYMDTIVERDGVFCWPHLMPMPATAKGPVLVLGMPFLRTYYTTFDAEQQRVGFAVPRQPPRNTQMREGSAPALQLRGVRPGDTELGSH